MGRQEGALRSDRRQIDVRGPTESLFRFCSDLRPEAQAPSLRAFEGPRDADEPAGDVLFRWGSDIRELQQYLNPEAEYYLDWFHITMRLTVMGQYAKGLETTQERREETHKSLESVKHYLSHGNVARTRDRIEDIHCFLDNEELTGENSRKPRKALDEVDTYIVANEALIPNYGERWRNEEAIATGLCGIGGKPNRKQAVRQKAADAMDQEKFPSGAANAHSGAR
jgi:hypothetical protein